MPRQVSPPKLPARDARAEDAAPFDGVALDKFVGELVDAGSERTRGAYAALVARVLRRDVPASWLSPTGAGLEPAHSGHARVDLSTEPPIDRWVERLVGAVPAFLSDDADALLEAAGALHQRVLARQVLVRSLPTRRVRLSAPAIARTSAATRDVASSTRQRHGAFYTPTPIVEGLLALILPDDEHRVAPIADANANTASHLPRVLDPSCGVGNFLVPACRRIARQHAVPLCDVVRAAPAGVDVDPLAVLLCRAVLFVLAGREASTLDVLGRRIVVGDALRCEPLVAPAKDSPRRRRARARVGVLSRGVESGDALFSWARAFPEELAADPDACSAPRDVASDERATRVAHRGFDAIVGNPPFLAQLARSTARARDDAETISRWSGGAVARYADSAAAFMLLGAHLVRPGGRVALLMPASILQTHDAHAVRRAVLERCELQAVWVDGGRVFHAAVRVCAPVLRRRLDDGACELDASDASASARVRLLRGTRFERVPDAQAPVTPTPITPTPPGDDWHVSVPLDDDPGVALPRVVGATPALIADLAHATADFRDQYYALAGAIVDDAELSPAQRADTRGYPRLVTTGLIDLGDCLWGRRAVRVHKQVRAAPRIDRRALERDPVMREWLASRLVPKLLLATQTRAVELLIDDLGELVPLVPLVVVTARSGSVDDLWRIGASLASPVTTLAALRRHAGAAMNPGALKLSARQALALERCPESSALDHAQSLLRQLHERSEAPERGALLDAFGVASCEAFGLDAPSSRTLIDWWLSRLTRRRRDPIPSTRAHKLAPAPAPATPTSAPRAPARAAP
jgi:hypothetical protein